MLGIAEQDEAGMGATSSSHFPLGIQRASPRKAVSRASVGAAKPSQKV